MTDKPQKIVRLEAENIMRLQAVEITPDGDLVVVGGRNAQGKSSVLNAIAMALGGTSEVPDEPIRRGKKRAQVILELDDLIVTRHFATGKTSKLEVRARDGEKLKSPQSILDSLIGGLKKLRITFDPLEFVRADPKSQLEILKELVGLDLGDLDEKRGEHYQERTGVNREVKKLRGALQSLPYHPEDTPKDEVSVSALIKKRDEVHRTISENERKRREFGNLEDELRDRASELESARRRVADLENDVATFEESVEKMRAEVDVLEDPPVASLDEKIATAEDVNRRVRENAEHSRRLKEVLAMEKEAKTLTDQIGAIDDERALRISSASFPVEGLDFGEDGIVFNEIPFEQASQAEQLRVAVAIGLAMNPQLRVLVIRDGSLLDDENLAALAKLAEDSNAQLWIERVGDGEECSVVIEDGRLISDDAE